ncbi:hypothetical protein JW758_00385 [Candidatus Peregrinibacteria bacterium]|nr:hypothetical protein [Candidatus Peregrinibacteria bacterium]
MEGLDTFIETLPTITSKFEGTHTDTNIKVFGGWPVRVKRFQYNDSEPKFEVRLGVPLNSLKGETQIAVTRMKSVATLGGFNGIKIEEDWPLATLNDADSTKKFLAAMGSHPDMQRWLTESE